MNTSKVKKYFALLLVVFSFIYSVSLVGLFVSSLMFVNFFFHSIRIRKLEKKINFIEHLKNNDKKIDE